MSLITQEGRRGVSAAIAEAERRTSGEIVAVITPYSASYLSIPFLIAAAVALFVPWPLIYFTWMTVQWIFALQLAVFLILVLALLAPGIRFRLAPRSVRRNRAHHRAVEQFRARNLDTAAGRTGVLLFVSVAEHFAEIIADTGLHQKVKHSTWKEIVDRLTAEIGAGRADTALTEAIGRIGSLMAEHFPARAGDVHPLPDHLIVLE